MSSVTVSAAKFAAAIAAARSIVMSKADIPVLQCVKLSAQNGTLTVSATDLSQGVAYHVPCEGSGLWLVTFDRLQSFVSACNKQSDIRISGDGVVQFKCGSVSARIPGLNPADFPDLLETPAIDGEPHFEGSVFGASLAKSAAMCDRKGAIWMSGVYVAASSGNCRMQVTTAAVSGWRDIAAPRNIEVSAFISAEFCSVIASLFDGVPIWVSGQGQTFWAHSSAITYYCKCLDAEAVDISGVTANSQATVSVDTETLSAAAKSVRSVAESKSNAVYINAGGVGSFVGATDGTSSLCVPFQTDGASEFSITVNAEKLVALLNACGAETATVGMSDGSGIIRSPHLQLYSNGFFGLLSPMQERKQDTQAILAAYLGNAPERLAA